MLNSTLTYLHRRREQDKGFTFEILVVDDGSTDSQNDLILATAKQYPREIRLLKQPTNMGKGAAVQIGCLHARGRFILFTDADGATPTSEIVKLEFPFRHAPKIASRMMTIGVRADPAGRSWLRRFLSAGFRFLTTVSGVRGVADVQCGFKLLSREAARLIFPSQHIRRWCMDVEILMIAQRLKIPIAQVAVEWREPGGSKMTVKGAVRMGADLVRIAVFYRTGIWTVRGEEQKAESDL
jgi:dolichyl-phosphate beta-glucosyltransferase